MVGFRILWAESKDLSRFEYDRAGTVLALAIQYSRRHVRKELRGESFHVLESSQVIIPSACLKTTLFTFSEYNRLLCIR
jgi:hypothetical protein